MSLWLVLWLTLAGLSTLSNSHFMMMPVIITIIPVPRVIIICATADDEFLCVIFWNARSTTSGGVHWTRQIKQPVRVATMYLLIVNFVNKLKQVPHHSFYFYLFHFSCVSRCRSNIFSHNVHKNINKRGKNIHSRLAAFFNMTKIEYEYFKFKHCLTVVNVGKGAATDD